MRFEGKGLSASRERQTHQVVGAVLKFAVRAKHLPANPADGMDLPRLPEAEQRYLTHDQLHRVAVASATSAPSSSYSAAAVCGSARRPRYRLPTSTWRRAGFGCVDRDVCPQHGTRGGPTKNYTARLVPVVVKMRQHDVRRLDVTVQQPLLWA